MRHPKSDQAGVMCCLKERWLEREEMIRYALMLKCFKRTYSEHRMKAGTPAIPARPVRVKRRQCDMQNITIQHKRPEKR